MHVLSIEQPREIEFDNIVRDGRPSTSTSRRSRMSLTERRVARHKPIFCALTIVCCTAVFALEMQANGWEFQPLHCDATCADGRPCGRDGSPCEPNLMIGPKVSVMERLGFGRKAVSTRLPRLVYISLPGYASDDPERRDLRAFDGTIIVVAVQRSTVRHITATCSDFGDEVVLFCQYFYYILNQNYIHQQQ